MGLWRAATPWCASIKGAFQPPLSVGINVVRVAKVLVYRVPQRLIGEGVLFTMQDKETRKLDRASPD